MNSDIVQVVQSTPHVRLLEEGHCVYAHHAGACCCVGDLGGEAKLGLDHGLFDADPLFIQAPVLTRNLAGVFEDHPLSTDYSGAFSN